MARPRSKDEMIAAAVKGYDDLMLFVGSMSEKELNTPFDFSNDEKKTEAHWGRDKNLRDVLVHLYEWQTLLLKFIENNSGTPKIMRPFLPEPYSWKTYGDMNVKIQKSHQDTSLEDAKSLLNGTHTKVLEVAEGFTNEQLFTKKYYKWTGTTDLGSYFVSTLSSHYDWAIKKLKEHRKVVLK